MPTLVCIKSILTQFSSFFVAIRIIAQFLFHCCCGRCVSAFFWYWSSLLTFIAAKLCHKSCLGRICNQAEKLVQLASTFCSACQQQPDWNCIIAAAVAVKVLAFNALIIYSLRRHQILFKAFLCTFNLHSVPISLLA